MTVSPSRPVLFSGIQPTGVPMIGNYFGAIRQWVGMQDSHDCLFSIVDLHAITVAPNPVLLRSRCLDLLALYLACGIDPVRSIVFCQSHVPAHAELGWIMTCVAGVGELERMTQYKEKASRQDAHVGAGLFAYPALMAADILLYGTSVVPIGDDQRQHLELARELCRRWNHRYGALFVEPETLTPALGERIMNLKEPTRKMDKSSADPDTFIGLLDEPDAVARKIRSAVTDSVGMVVRDPARPGISNLIAIFALSAGIPADDVERRYVGQGYAGFKRDLTSAVVALLAPIQSAYRGLRPDEDGLRAILRQGAEAARRRAESRLRSVHASLGFIDPGPGNR